MGFIKEFREFAMRGNVIDMAVGIVIGGAFGKIVSSLVGDIVMPAVGMATGGVDFSEMRLVLQEADEAAGKALVAVSYGSFFSTIIDFVIIALAIFVVIKLMNSAKKRFEKEKEAAPAAPAAPSAQEVLLTEIRDLLRQRS